MKALSKLFAKKKAPAPVPESKRVLYAPEPERYVPSAALLDGGKEYTAFMKSKKANIASANPMMSLREVRDTAKNEWFIAKGKPQMPVVPEHIVKEHGKYFTARFIMNNVMEAAMDAFIKSKTTSKGKRSDAYKAAKAEWRALDAAAKWKCMEPLVAPMAAEEKERRRIAAMIAAASRKRSDMSSIYGGRLVYHGDAAMGMGLIATAGILSTTATMSAIGALF